ncbi:hypothetical protein IAD21_02567 [Abditibacteriota bacterium]|nr:hypothetical protein IAD21_02567 [Abditibacteriota bacterium]
MKHFLPQIGALVGLLTTISSVQAQPPQLPEPLYEQSFEQDAGTWLSTGGDAKVSMERAPENVKVGESALRFDYKVAPGPISILISPLAPRSLDTLQAISFWVKVNHNASLAFALQEQGGGRFGTVFSVAKDQWQHVEIAPQELVLQLDKDSPKDDDGKLDLDKVEGMALLDFNQMIAQLAADPNNPLIQLLGIETGPRTLYLDGVVFSSKPLSPALPSSTLLDDFTRPQAEWLSVGGATLKNIKGDAPETNALQVDYTQAAGRVAAFAKLLPPGVLVDKSKLSFKLASKRHATLIVQLEEKSGGKYNANFEVAGDALATEKNLDFTDFEPADDSKDDNNRLDLGQVKQILFIDASGLLGMGEGENTIWLNQIRTK